MGIALSESQGIRKVVALYVDIHPFGDVVAYPGLQVCVHTQLLGVGEVAVALSIIVGGNVDAAIAEEILRLYPERDIRQARILIPICVAG